MPMILSRGKVGGGGGGSVVGDNVPASKGEEREVERILIEEAFCNTSEFFYTLRCALYVCDLRSSSEQVLKGIIGAYCLG